MVSPLFPPQKKTDDFFSHHRLSGLQYHHYFFFKNTFFAHHCHFLISLWCHPLEGVTRTFLPVWPPLSTVLCKFSHKFFFHSGQSPPPSDATVHSSNKNNIAKCTIYNCPSIPCECSQTHNNTQQVNKTQYHIHDMWITQHLGKLSGS